MDRGCQVFSLLVFFCSLEFGLGTIFLLTVPKQLHYNAECTATVTAVEVDTTSGSSVTLEYRGATDHSFVFNKTLLRFDADGVQTWTVVFPWTRMQERGESGLKLHMYDRNTEKIATLQFSHSVGFIFIQTDKPIYTPRQTVKFRIIALDANQQLAKYPLKVDIKNEEGIIVDRIRYSAEDAFKAQEFELPRETPPGIWSISANFEEVGSAFQSTETVEFEVKEYVLPRFSATLHIEPDVITRTTTWLIFNISAQYVYGKPLIGQMEMQLGLWDDDHGIELYPRKYVEELKEGNVVQYMLTSSVIPASEPFPENKRLYVNINVTESGTLDNFTFVDTSTYISHPYYVVDFSDSKKSFKPGFPYTLQLQARTKSGRLASWINLAVMIDFLDSLNQTISTSQRISRMNGQGRHIQEIESPVGTSAIFFKVVVADFKNGDFHEHHHLVPAYRSRSKDYIHISLKEPLEKSKDGSILLRYTEPVRGFFFNTPDPGKIIVSVLSKGRVIYTTSTPRTYEGRSTVTLPSSLYSEATPGIRIVAYFHVNSHGHEFVIDSLMVDTDDVCLEEVDLSRPGGTLAGDLIYKPKDNYPLGVRGGPGMRVGLVAVDKAVLLLNDKLTLTRESMFMQYSSHDLGKGNGDGNNFTDILLNSGLELLYLDTDEYSVNGEAESVLRPGSKGLESLEITEPNGIESSRNTGSRPQTVRRYFPESWLFDDVVLPSSGYKELNMTLPDSITTWSFMAIGLSATKGFCVSSSLEQKVQKLFFVDIRLPYKVTRLEEVKVKIAVYNFKLYSINVKIDVSGEDGLCFAVSAAKGEDQQSTTFTLSIPGQQTKGEVIKVIPLRTGELTLRVHVFTHVEQDTVEKKLYVVSEGLKVKKALTFVLDPEAKHATLKTIGVNKIKHIHTATINNTFDTEKKEQHTVIDLAMPNEVIQGSEFCSISVFGDLMGDIINHAVVEAKSLLDYSITDTAIDVLGDLGPTVHALLYLNKTGWMDEETNQRGRRFIRNAVTRLLKYNKDSYFVLTPESKPATWLSSFVLKNLCHASALTYVDRESLIDNGFHWLWNQVKQDGGLREQDLRLANDSLEYRVMLAAEVVISVQECDRLDKEIPMNLRQMGTMYLKNNIRNVKRPLVLAKLAYALSLFDPQGDSTLEVVKKLQNSMKKNKLSQFYWSDETETDEDSQIPFWYHQGAKASSIEATAYSLLVFLIHGGVNVDVVADWLVAQRQTSGAFIGAMDSTVAIQALSMYSLLKHGIKLDLHCNVGSDRIKEYRHSFSFTEKNATSPGSLSNVPVGQVLQVLTKGQGLGQMQINVEYNVPIDKNKDCPFNISVEVRETEFHYTPDMNSNPLCAFCDIGCKERLGSILSGSGGSNSPPFDIFAVEPDPRVRIYMYVNRDRNNTRGIRKIRYDLRRKRRNAISENLTRSKKSICLHICVIHRDEGLTGPIDVDLEMLSGYQPVDFDVQKINDQPDVRHAQFHPDTEILTIQFTKIEPGNPTCVDLRAVDELEIGRQTPASVKVTEVGRPYPFCSVEYDPVAGEESLQVYCADFSNSNRGECRCFSGICSSCGPMTRDEFKFHDVKKITCKTAIAYQIQMTDVHYYNYWTEVDAVIISVNKTGRHNVTSGDMIRLVSPRSCGCPAIFYINKDQPYYLLSADVEKLVDKDGNEVFKYLLDERSALLRVSVANGVSLSSEPAIPLLYLAQSLKSQDQCSV